MMATPAASLSTVCLCLSLLCLSVCGQVTDNNTTTSQNPSGKVSTSTNPTTDLHSTTSLLPNVNGTGADAGGGVPQGQPSSNQTTAVTKDTPPHDPATQTMSQTVEEVTQREEGQRFMPIPKGESPQRSNSALVVMILLVVVVLLMLSLAFVSYRLKRGPCSPSNLATITGEIRVLQSWLGICRWPGKSGGQGGGEEDDEEEEEAEEEEGGSGRDVERGTRKDGYSLTERTEGAEEDGEDEESSDYSSLEGMDLRERARQRDEAEVVEEGKKESETESGSEEEEEEEEEEEGEKGGGLAPADQQQQHPGNGKKEGEMECDLTAL